MSRDAQAPIPCLAHRYRLVPAHAAVLASCLVLSACGSAGSGMRKARVDPTIVTSDVSAPTRGGADAERLSDQATVRNAVSSADIDLLAGAAVRWANGQTGARGSITGLTESSRHGKPCRGFVTTRESYDGVRLFSGETCMVSAGLWRMETFEQL